MVKVGMDPEFAVSLLRRMLLIRRFEERVVELVDANEIAGVCHESIGQEGVAVGICSALRKSDVITSTHRGHGHMIAKGADVALMMAELLGRATGYNHGRGGSMHIADVSNGVFGANGIVGAGTPMACGAAYAFRQDGNDGVAVSFFGDGALNQGVALESFNLAAIWQLPVVFVCENNLYAVTTKISDVMNVDPATRARGFGLPAESIDGMDVAAVNDQARIAVDRARNGGGPSFIDCRTYRFSGHQTAERAMGLTYRTKDEIETWRKSDPISSWERRLMIDGLIEIGVANAIRSDVDVEIERAIEFARGSAWPDPSAALDHMYATEYTGLPSWGVM